MVRAPYFDANGTKKGAWSEEEDQKLIAYIQKHGHPNWRQLPSLAGLTRCGKSCRLRWMNYLRPNLKRGKYTKKEEEMIMELHEKHGNKWSLIAEKLPGRTDNEIKNYWHSNLKKFSKSKFVDQCTESETSEAVTVSVDSNHILESSMSSSEVVSCSTKDNSSSYVELYREQQEESTVIASSWETVDGFSNNFWTEPFILENALRPDSFPISYYQVEAEDQLLW